MNILKEVLLSLRITTQVEKCDYSETRGSSLWLYYIFPSFAGASASLSFLNEYTHFFFFLRRDTLKKVVPPVSSCQQGVCITSTKWVMISGQRHCCWVFQLYFFCLFELHEPSSICFHSNGKKLQEAHISNTEQLTVPLRQAESHMTAVLASSFGQLADRRCDSFLAVSHLKGCIFELQNGSRLLIWSSTPLGIKQRVGFLSVTPNLDSSDWSCCTVWLDVALVSAITPGFLT